ncbi:hypothetical protein, partial [Streptococcus pneumoniae]|uniref:hypothetical protein n=1 Tax=Streptococcus pneumoniae TaxID=1313 RepID=UPI001953CA96
LRCNSWASFPSPRSAGDDAETMPADGAAGRVFFDADESCRIRHLAAGGDACLSCAQPCP